MFGLELWFVLSVVSAVTGGLFIFVTKVASERDADIVLLSTVAIGFSGVLLLAYVVIRADYSGMTPIVLFFAALNAVLYFFANILRHSAQQCIDTAVYYPVYKTLTPTIAIFIGVTLFSEQFTSAEWIGLALSLMVPLMLITHAEKERQKDLFRGLRLLSITALIAVAASASLKAATQHTDNVWLFIALSDLGLVAVGFFMLFFQRGKQPLPVRLQALTDTSFLWLAFWMGSLSAVAFVSLVFALSLGALGIVYTVQSLYILIPIILSIIYYNEHWNARKVIAIVLSIAALGLLK